MTMRTITSPAVPAPPPQLFTNAKRVGDMLFVSGMHAGDGKGGVAGDGSTYAQAREALTRIRHLVEAAGGTMNDIVKLGVFATDIADRMEISRARREFFTGDFPCATLVEVSALVDPQLTVEIEAIAIIGAGGR
ncbi:MAG: RidA family protein [Candidatus Eiseniibacteriota bacterium]